MRAREFEGIDIDVEEDADEITVRAMAGGRQMGYAYLVKDGQELLPQELEVDPRYQGQGIARVMYDFLKNQGYRIRRSGQQTDAGQAFWQKHRPSQNVWESQRRLPHAIEEFLDSLNPDDCGVEDIGAYRIHFEGFTSNCKSSADYRRNPEAVYQQVYRDFIQREGGDRPIVQDMVGDEDFPILYSIFRIKKQPMRESLDQPYPLTWEKSEADESVDALARLPDGSNLSIMFNQDMDDEGEGIYSVEFWRNNSQEVTGQGDAQRVFATVLSAIAQFIAKRNPEQLYFSANKDVEPGQKAGSRSNLYTSLVRRYASALGYEADVSDFAGSTSYKLYKLHEQREAQTRQATARQVLNYINKTHHEPFRPGEKMYAAVMAHPQWQLKRVPLLNLNIPDQEYDDVDYDDEEPESDPYGRAMLVDPEHAGRVSQDIVDQRPIVIDADRYIIDGNHRAWAAKYLLNRDYIDAWVPV